MKFRKLVFLFFISFVLLCSVPPIGCYGLDFDIGSYKSTAKPKLDSRLLTYLESLDSEFDILSEDIKPVRVVVELAEGEENRVDSLISLGFRVESRYRNLVQGYATPSLIEYLLGLDYISVVRAPRYAHTSISEGVEAISADDLHSIAFDGTGVKIAILDGGFEGYTALLGTELPSSVTTKSYPSGGLTSGGIHGTACAEVVYDVAPGADMYLVKVETGLDFLNAVDWLIDQDVDVISCSIGWPIYGAGDGTGDICDKVDEAASSGILFVTAAGNEAKKHYEGVFSDPNSDSWHNFGATQYIPITMYAGETLSLDMRWSSAWSVTQHEDYDLFLCDSSNTVVAYSINDQSSSGFYPYEGIDYSVPANDVYRIYIQEYQSSADFSLELFANYPLDQYRTATGSLVSPGDAAGAFTVGATDWSDDSLHDYSSQGPTNDGRTKPDVTAPSRVTNTVYGTFSGTSAATPHTAGAAALLLQQKSLSVNELRSSLENTAVDLGDGGKDNLYGAGRINVFEARLLENTPATTSITSPNTGQYSTTITVDADAVDTDGETKSVEFQYNLDTSDLGDAGWVHIGTDTTLGDGWSIDWTTSAYTTSTAYVRARAFDGLEYGDWDTCDNPLTIDNTPPNSPTLTETVCGVSWTTSDTPCYEWSNPGDTGTSVQYYQGQLDSEAVSTVTSPHQPTLSDGEHTYKVRAVDQLGNTGDWSNPVTVQIDTTGPTGSISINSGGVSTTSRDVTLTLTGEDSGSGLQDISFSNDGVDWSTPEVFTATKSWQLTEGLEEKTVYLRLRDNLGTETTLSDTILLDAEPADFTLNLDSGWNLVSFPLNLDDPDVSAVMAGVSSYTIKSWSGTEYVTPSIFEPGKAYWIKVDAETRLSLYGTDVTTLDLDLVTGYNLIGGPISTIQADTVLSGFYVVAAWDTGYVSSLSFEPGIGYLVLVLSSTNIVLE